MPAGGLHRILDRIQRGESCWGTSTIRTILTARTLASARNRQRTQGPRLQAAFLDKLTGGRAIRGLLGGKPQELLSVIPGSDALGLTNESDRVSGKDLLGLKGSDGLLPSLAGTAAEIALDPSTYFSPASAIAKAAPAVKGLLGGISPGLASAAGTAAKSLGGTAGLGTGEGLGGLSSLAGIGPANTLSRYLGLGHSLQGLGALSSLLR
jgi:hypothetical protein